MQQRTPFKHMGFTVSDIVLHNAVNRDSKIYAIIIITMKRKRVILLQFGYSKKTQHSQWMWDMEWVSLQFKVLPRLYLSSFLSFQYNVMFERVITELDCANPFSWYNQPITMYSHITCQYYIDLWYYTSFHPAYPSRCIMLTVVALSRFAVICYWWILPIFVRVTSLTVELPYVIWFPSARETAFQYGQIIRINLPKRWCI